jgi:hypothetical protein
MKKRERNAQKKVPFRYANPPPSSSFNQREFSDKVFALSSHFSTAKDLRCHPHPALLSSQQPLSFDSITGSRKLGLVGSITSEALKIMSRIIDRSVPNVCLFIPQDKDAPSGRRSRLPAWPFLFRRRTVRIQQFCQAIRSS